MKNYFGHFFGNDAEREPCLTELAADAFGLFERVLLFCFAVVAVAK